MKIGLLSDTHGYLDPALTEYLETCDEIWHAGDIGTIEVCDQLEALKPFRAVFGNIDGPEIQRRYPEDLFFEVEGIKVCITHIGGYPPRYNRRAKAELLPQKPKIFICGHSHILKVMVDKDRDNLLCLNPGAAGRQGFHKVRTALMFVVDNGEIKDLEVIELGAR